MPKATDLDPEKVSIEEIRRLLNKLQSYEKVGKLYDASGRSVSRFVSDDLERKWCWVYKKKRTIDATFTATLTARSVEDEKGERQ